MSVIPSGQSPDPLGGVEIGRVRRQKPQFEFVLAGLEQGAQFDRMMKTSVVQDQDGFCALGEGRQQLFEKGPETLGVESRLFPKLKASGVQIDRSKETDLFLRRKKIGTCFSRISLSQLGKEVKRLKRVDELAQAAAGQRLK